MLPSMSERAKALVFLAVWIVAIAGLYGWVQAVQPASVASMEVRDVSLLVDGGAWRFQYGPVTTQNNTAFGILWEAARRLHVAVVWTNYSYGVFVISINGTANGAGGWQYWVGTVYGNVAADRYPLVNGSNVTWRFTTDQGGVLT